MDIALITGSAGLIGSQATRFFVGKGYMVVGIDNNMRQAFFGVDASTEWNRKTLERDLEGSYIHYNSDIRDVEAMEQIFAKYGSDIKVIIHTAAQPSHDWASGDPITDFTVNANGTLILLEKTREHTPEASFIFTSTNKVYGDEPNRLPLVELETRWECDKAHPLAAHGVDESMTIDQSTHSLFGVSKVAADLMTQEYGRYFDMNTVVFRGGCLTGADHSGTQLHGFLAYLAKCAILGTRYTIFGYQGKQVRDNIHASDLVNAFWHYVQNPRSAEVYNIGGGRHSNCSMQEAIAICEKLTGKTMNVDYSETNRVGDHIWYISDIRKFENHYPGWRQQYTIETTLAEIINGVRNRLSQES